MAQAVSYQAVPQKTWFIPMSVITEFMVDIVTLEQIFMHVHFFVRISIIPPMLHNLAFIYANTTQS
jgi:hypothetical protein